MATTDFYLVAWSQRDFGYYEDANVTLNFDNLYIDNVNIPAHPTALLLGSGLLGLPGLTGLTALRRRFKRA